MADPLLEAQARLLSLRENLLKTSLTRTFETPMFAKSTVCLRCKADLPEDRMALCIECDRGVDEELARRAARDEHEATERRLRLSGLPLAYRDGSRLLGDLPLSTADVMSLCQMLGNGLRGLYLHGPAGAYKTSVAAAFLASQIRGGARGLYISVQDLMSDLHASYNGSGETRAAIVERLVDAPCLVLDDLGKEKPSEHAAGALFEILDGRYRAATNWLIVTSNYALPELAERLAAGAGEVLADPIRRRLSELTMAVQMDARR